MTVLKTSKRAHDKSQLLTTRSASQRKDEIMRKSTNTATDFYSLRSESVQSCLVIVLNVLLLLCFFAGGSEVKAPPSCGMSFNCIVKIRHEFPKESQDGHYQSTVSLWNSKYHHVQSDKSRQIRVECFLYSSVALFLQSNKFQEKVYFVSTKCLRPSTFSKPIQCH